MYVQEVGHGGRDGAATFATLFYAKSLRFVNKAMLEYAEQLMILIYTNMQPLLLDVNVVMYVQLV